MARGQYMDLDFFWDGAKGAARLLRLAPKAISRAERRAISKATRGAKIDVSQVLRNKVGLNMKSRDLKSYVKSHNPLRVGGEWLGQVKISTKPLPLMLFSPRPSSLAGAKPRVGVSVLVLKGGGRKTLPGSFLATWRRKFVVTGISGHQHMKRLEHVNIYRRKGKERLPIKVLYTAGPGHYLDQGDGKREVEKRILVRLDKEMERSIEYELKKSQGRIKRRSR